MKDSSASKDLRHLIRETLLRVKEHGPAIKENVAEINKESVDVTLSLVEEGLVFESKDTVVPIVESAMISTPKIKRNGPGKHDTILVSFAISLLTKAGSNQMWIHDSSDRLFAGTVGGQTVKPTASEPGFIWQVRYAENYTYDLFVRIPIQKGLSIPSENFGRRGVYFINPESQRAEDVFSDGTEDIRAGDYTFKKEPNGFTFNFNTRKYYHLNGKSLDSGEMMFKKAPDSGVGSGLFGISYKEGMSLDHIPTPQSQKDYLGIRPEGSENRFEGVFGWLGVLGVLIKKPGTSIKPEIKRLAQIESPIGLRLRIEKLARRHASEENRVFYDRIEDIESNVLKRANSTGSPQQVVDDIRTAISVYKKSFEEMSQVLDREPGKGWDELENLASKMERNP